MNNHWIGIGLGQEHLSEQPPTERYILRNRIKELERQVAEMRALLARVEEVNAAEYYHVTALQDEIKAYLEGSNKSNG